MTKAKIAAIREQYDRRVSLSRAVDMSDLIPSLLDEVERLQETILRMQDEETERRNEQAHQTRW